MTVKVAGKTLAVKVVLQLILLSRALADVADITVRLKITDQTQPSLARRSPSQQQTVESG